MRKAQVPVLMTEPALCPQGRGHWRPSEYIKSKVHIFIKGRGKKRGAGGISRLAAVIKDYRDGGRTKAAGACDLKSSPRGGWTGNAKAESAGSDQAGGERWSEGLSRSPVTKSCQPQAHPHWGWDTNWG